MKRPHRRASGRLRRIRSASRSDRRQRLASSLRRRSRGRRRDPRQTAYNNKHEGREGSRTRRSFFVLVAILRELRASMSEIERFKPDDRRGVDTLYRRTNGPDAAEANRLRWDWQHRRNPYNRTGEPGIWVAREGPTVVGQYPTLPVRISLKGLEVDGSWGAGALVAPERDSQGLDEALLRTWDRNSGAVLTLGVAGGSKPVADRLHWPQPHALPCLVKPLTRRAVRLPHWPTALNRLVSALTLPVVYLVSRSRPLRAECEPIRRFDSSFTALWERLAPKFDLGVR